MSGWTCKDTKELLERPDRLHPEEVTELRRHTKSCADCRADLWVSEQLASPQTAPALSGARQARILAGVQRAMRAGAQTADARPAPWRLVVALSAAAVAVAIVLLALRFRGGTEHGSDTPTAIALTTGGGVRARVLPGTDAHYEADASGPLLVLTRGTLFVDFDRARATGPLTVRTPKAELVVRGTRFYVRASATSTEVGVRRGHVDVQADRVLALVAGTRAAIGPQGTSQGALESRDAQELDALFGAEEHAPPPEVVALPHDNELIPEAPEDATSPAKSPGKAPSKQARRHDGAQTTQAMSRRATVTEARKRFKRGEPQQALDLLASALGSGEDDPGAKQDALYLMGVIYRSQREFRRAVDVLQQAAQGSTSATSRLARLERANIFLFELHEPAKARSDLELLIAQGERDAVAEEAYLALCAAMIEERDLTRADRCLTRFTSEYPDSARSAKASELKRRLEPLLHKEQ